ncbi:hypothetical protein ACFRJ9_09055 [Paenarthrobacter sp. NPDC056912]|uniref:hypothetical protein n=1 Tax=Paenarthrobacter sp. NPDC056912 TaxID=3345965 RepID=UPI00366F9D6C
MVRRMLTEGQRRPLALCMLIASSIALVAGCDGSPLEPPSTSGVASTAEQQPITVEVNQSRDQYGKQAIQIQLTNTTDTPLTVTGARLDSPLFDGGISWEPTAGTLELPPRQPKSLPASLPAADCRMAGDASPAPIGATVRYAEPGGSPQDTATTAADPFGVLARNAGELCLAKEASAVATIVLAPGLDVAADGRTAVVRLLITPVAPSGAAQTLTIESIEETTLLAEPPTEPWPTNVLIRSGADRQEIALGIRPVRCDPHAVAEDKVGTLLPLRIKVGDRQGQLKIAASTELRGRIYDFVTAACSGQ